MIDYFFIELFNRVLCVSDGKKACAEETAYDLF